MSHRGVAVRVIGEQAVLVQELEELAHRVGLTVDEAQAGIAVHHGLTEQGVVSTVRQDAQTDSE